MARYIDLDKAIERLNASPAFGNMGTNGYFLLDVVKDLLNRLPTLNVKIVKHGTWSKGKEMSEYAHCSACNQKMNSYCYGYAYCPLCGARMDGGRAE